MVRLGSSTVGFDFALRGADRLRDSLLHAFLFGHEFGIAAEQNVGAAARHVGGDGDHAFASGLRDNFRFALVILGIQTTWLDPFFLQQFRKALGFFDRGSADEHGLVALMQPSEFRRRPRNIFLFPCGKRCPDSLCATARDWSE